MNQRDLYHWDEVVTDQVKENLQYLRDVFPSRGIYDRLVQEGAYGDEIHRIDGDDLAGACWALNNLFDILSVEPR